jgi:hypothetical protein
MTVPRLSGGLTPGAAGDPRTFPQIWNATADVIDTAVLSTSVSGNVFVVTSERNAALTAGQNLAVGNGATDKQASLPFACKVLSLTFSPGPAHTGSTTLEVVKNGTAQGSDYRVVASGTSVQSLVFSTPLSLAAGDRFAVQCTDSTTPGDGGIASLVIRFD